MDLTSTSERILGLYEKLFVKAIEEGNDEILELSNDAMLVAHNLGLEKDISKIQLKILEKGILERKFVKK